MRSATRAPANPPAEILKNQKSLSVTRKKEQSKWVSTFGSFDGSIRLLTEGL
jgi:hypothetical protein